MKKLISIILLFALVLSCCACDANQPTNPVDTTDATVGADATEATEPSLLTPEKEEEEDFSAVNELEPNEKGVYQIHSIEGLLNIANHLDGEFELLCDIDLAGAAWVPIGTQETPFTGTLKGNEFTISNFKIEQPTADGDMGFFGVNAGMVLQLCLADVTVTATDTTVRVGSLAGSNSGTLRRCTSSGTLTVSAAAADAFCGGAVGVNTGDLRNTVVDMDVNYTAPGSANIGGLVGSFTAGTLRDTDTKGRLEVTGAEGKSIGLFAGYAKDVEIERAVFLGEANRIDGELFITYIGKSENAVATDCLWRDNSAEELAPEIRQIREEAVQAMRDMGTVLWTVTQTLGADCVGTCSAGLCHTALVPGQVYRGVPYKHNAGSLDRLLYCLDENNVMEDWVYEQGSVGGYQNYMGSDCYRACQLAWATVANSMNSGNAMSNIMYTEDVGTIPIGQWAEKWPAENRLNDQYTTKITNYMTEQELYEDYAQIHAGDVLIQIVSVGAHAIMASTDAVVVRDENGLIDPNESYIYNHEQGGDNNTSDEWISSWGIDNHKTFSRLIGDGYLPITIQEMQEGEQDVPEAHLEGGADGQLGLMTGIVTSNFYVDSVTMVITDAQGNEVFNKKMFSRLDKITDYDGVSMFERVLVTEFDMANFTNDIMALEFKSGEAYQCTITANLHTGDHIVVKYYNF